MGEEKEEEAEKEIFEICSLQQYYNSTASKLTDCVYISLFHASSSIYVLTFGYCGTGIIWVGRAESTRVKPLSHGDEDFILRLLVSGKRVMIWGRGGFQGDLIWVGG